MSNANNNKDTSDDEFQDAESSPTNPNKQKTNEEIIDEITTKQSELILTDDEENEAAAFSEAEGAAAATTEDAAAKEIDESEAAEELLKKEEESLSEEELQRRKEEADRLKLEGNELFKNDAADKSIEIYTTALQICPTRHAKERAILYGNRAAAKIKIDSKNSAIDDCTRAIDLWPEYVRAILRRAKLYHDAEKLEEALKNYQRVYELDPGNPEAREAMIRLPPLIEQRNEKLKEEMMSKLKDLGNMILKPFGLSTANFQMQQDPSSGSYSINFNQNS